jgi:hypothetical protein
LRRLGVCDASEENHREDGNQRPAEQWRQSSLIGETTSVSRTANLSLSTTTSPRATRRIVHEHVNGIPREPIELHHRALPESQHLIKPHFRPAQLDLNRQLNVSNEVEVQQRLRILSRQLAKDRRMISPRRRRHLARAVGAAAPPGRSGTTETGTTSSAMIHRPWRTESDRGRKHHRPHADASTSNFDNGDSPRGIFAPARWDIKGVLTRNFMRSELNPNIKLRRALGELDLPGDIVRLLRVAATLHVRPLRVLALAQLASPSPSAASPPR